MEDVARELGLLLAGGALAVAGGALQQWFAHRLRKAERQDERRDDARAALPRLVEAIEDIRPASTFRPPSEWQLERGLEESDRLMAATHHVRALAMLDPDEEVQARAEKAASGATLARHTAVSFYRSHHSDEESQRTWHEHACDYSALGLEACHELAEVLR